MATQPKSAQLSDQLCKEVLVRNVPPHVHAELKSIAAYSGVSMSDLLRPHFAKIAEGYPVRARTFKPLS